MSDHVKAKEKKGFNTNVQVVPLTLVPVFKDLASVKGEYLRRLCS